MISSFISYESKICGQMGEVYYKSGKCPNISFDKWLLKGINIFKDDINVNFSFEAAKVPFILYIILIDFMYILRNFTDS